MSNAAVATRFNRPSIVAHMKRAAGRAFWALGAVAHVPAVLGLLAADWSQGDGVIRALLLVIGLAFCVLKVADWSMLRVNPGWRGRVLCLLALALLHVGLIPQLDREDVDFCLTTTTGISALVVLTYVAVDRGGAPDRARCRHDDRLPATYPWSSDDGLFALIAQRIGLPSAGPRSPPCLA
jgi:hypothetical protein